MSIVEKCVPKFHPKSDYLLYSQSLKNHSQMGYGLKDELKNIWSRVFMEYQKRMTAHIL